MRIVYTLHVVFKLSSRYSDTSSVSFPLQGVWRAVDSPCPDLYCNDEICSLIDNSSQLPDFVEIWNFCCCHYHMFITLSGLMWFYIATLCLMSYSTFAYVCSVKLLTYLRHQTKHIVLLPVTAGNINKCYHYFCSFRESCSLYRLTASFSASSSSDERTAGCRYGDLGDHVELADAHGRDNG